MATFTKSVPLLVLLTLLFCLQTFARESRFFSKVTRDSPEYTKPTVGAQQLVNVDAKEEEQPAFLPQTPDNAPYGLYGRQADVEFPPSTTTTTTKKYSQEQHQPVKEDPTYYNNNNNNYFNNVENFETKEESTPAAAATTSAEPEFYSSAQRKNYAAQLQGLDGYAKGTGSGYYYNSEKQGISDTRYLENGRYFHDVKNEKPAVNRLPTFRNEKPAVNGLPTYRYGAYQSRSYERPAEYYNNDGYYSGSTESFNDNYYKNTRHGFQQQQQEEEFDFDP